MYLENQNVQEIFHLGKHTTVFQARSLLHPIVVHTEEEKTSVGASKKSTSTPTAKRLQKWSGRPEQETLSGMRWCFGPVNLVWVLRNEKKNELARLEIKDTCLNWLIDSAGLRWVASLPRTLTIILCASLIPPGMLSLLRAGGYFLRDAHRQKLFHAYSSKSFYLLW